MAGYGTVVSGPKFAGVDQGIDFTGPGSIFAFAEGIVTKIVKTASGWPGEGALLVYKITGGQYAGRYVYVAEDFRAAPGLRVGSKVSKGQVIGYATGSGKAPGIEMGWATAKGSPVAPLYPNPHGPKPAGQSFLNVITGGTGLSSTPVLNTLPGTGVASSLTGKDLLAYVITEAQKLGLEAKAVTSVITQEGGFEGAVGDQGTSYGPFQLHKGGSLPSWVAARGPAFAQQWAQTPAGVSYGLQQEAKVAKGETGLKAIQDIVFKFERPAKPEAETVAAYKQYLGWGSNWTDKVAETLTGGIEKPLKWGEAFFQFLSKLADPVFWLRVLEMLAGGVLLLTGLYLLVRQVGLSTPSPPGPARRVAETVA